MQRRPKEELPDEELDRLCRELERLGRIAGVPKVPDTDKPGAMPALPTSVNESTR